MKMLTRREMQVAGEKGKEKKQIHICFHDAKTLRHRKQERTRNRGETNVSNAKRNNKAKVHDREKQQNENPKMKHPFTTLIDTSILESIFLIGGSFTASAVLRICELHISREGSINRRNFLDPGKACSEVPLQEKLLDLGFPPTLKQKKSQHRWNTRKEFGGPKNSYLDNDMASQLIDGHVADFLALTAF
jgi:hypothetical protein